LIPSTHGNGGEEVVDIDDDTDGFLVEVTGDGCLITSASVVSGLDGQVGEHLVSNGGLGGSISVDLDHELVILEDQALLLAHDAEFTVNKVTGQQISAVGLFVVDEVVEFTIEGQDVGCSKDHSNGFVCGHGESA